MRKIWNYSKHLYRVFRETLKSWKENDDIGLLSAALSFYAIFSLPGLLVVVIYIAGYFFGADAVSGRVYSEVKEYIGSQGALQVQDMIRNASASKNSTIATIIGIGALIYSSTGVMYQLQQSLNRIWKVKVKPKRAILKLIRDRLFSFGMIVVLGFLLMVSLVVASLVNAITEWISYKLFAINAFTLNLIGITITLVVDTVIFILVYKVLPDVKILWRHVWVGALATTVLFEIGKFLIGFYIANSNPGSTYGAAGSIILILVWVSYSSLILFFGAMFTEAYARLSGDVIKSSDYAVKVTTVKVEVPAGKKNPA